jgi:hypothetical protein
MDKDVNRLAVDQHALDRKVQTDVLKRLEILVGVSLHCFEGIGGQNNLLECGTIVIDVRFSERLHGAIDSENAVMILGILDRFPTAPEANKQHSERAAEGLERRHSMDGHAKEYRNRAISGQGTYFD